MSMQAMEDLKSQAELIRGSKLFDPAWYLRQYVDVMTLGLDPAEHYLRFGADALRNPSARFDTEHYLRANRDVARSGLNPLVHYLRFGQSEGRSFRSVSEPFEEPVWDAASTGLLALLYDTPYERGEFEAVERPPVFANVPADALTVAWVINQHDKMTQQYRVHNYAAELRELGVHVAVLGETDLLGKSLDRVDVLVMCRVAPDVRMLGVIDRYRAKGGFVVFDVDDLVFDPDRLDLIRHVAARPDDQREAFRKTMASWREMLWRSDLATVSTYALKTEVERLGKPALILPNNIARKDEARAAELVAARKDNTGRRTRLAYFSGTRSHEHDFEECLDALRRIMRERDDIELMVVGHLESAQVFREFGERFIELPLMRHADMLEKLATVDINLAPLEYRNAFTHAKSELKIFEAALYEVPTIATPTASYAATITHGRNGLLASETDVWYRSIKKLVLHPELRRELGREARRTIASRFLVSQTVHEALAIYRAAKARRLRPLPPPSMPPVRRRTAIAIVSILYKKREEVLFFLESMRRQSFDRPYEIVLVDDVSPDDSVAVVEEFMRTSAALSDTNPNMHVRILRNESNLGNCSSRNRAIAESSSELVVVVDADCVFNRDFLATHYQAHRRGNCDVAIGPKGIETNGRPPMSVLGIHDADPSLAVPEARPQDGVNQDSFVNCVTRNFSVRRDLIAQLPGGELFDELFNYSASPESGFGWEDVEMGCRLHAAGARIKFLDDTASIHVSHPPAVANKDKPFRSLKNFRRLHEKHPELWLQARQWCHHTYEAILKWCRSVGGELAGNDDYRFLEALFKPQRQAPVVFTRPRPLRVLSFRWHCAHQYELYRLGHKVTLAKGMGTSLCNRWEWDHRPLPVNARMVDHESIDPRQYDVAILHFDENLLHPELCHGKVPMDWGSSFLRALREWDLPKVAICHGTPQFRGQYDIEYKGDDVGQVIEANRQELVELLREVMIVCNSHQAASEWKFHKSRTIWHGFSPHEFPPPQEYGKGVYSMATRAMSNRPFYNGWFVFERIRELLGEQVPINPLAYGGAPVSYTPRTAAWAQVKYENYVRAISGHDAYINPTIRSPMPRTRGEAMMAGVPTVSFRSHDVDMFIENGVNGFYADTADEMAEQVRFLLTNPSARDRIGAASRRTAMDVFNQDRYLSAWVGLLKDVVG